MVMGAAGEDPICDNNLEPDPTGAATPLTSTAAGQARCSA